MPDKGFELYTYSVQENDRAVLEEPKVIKVDDDALANGATPPELKDWFSLEQVDTLLNYSAAMKLTLGVGKLGRRGLGLLKDGHPVRPHNLKGAHTINRAFLLTQAYRLAQIDLLLFAKSFERQWDKDDTINFIGRRDAKSQLTEISFSPSSGTELSGVPIPNLDDPNGDSAHSFVKSLVLHFKAVIDLTKLQQGPIGTIGPRMPRPSQIRLNQSLFQPIDNFVGICVIWYSLKVTLHKDQKRFFRNLSGTVLSNKEGNLTNELEILIPLAVPEPGDKVENIDFISAGKAFTKNSFVLGFDLRFLFQMSSDQEDGETKKETLRAVPFGSIGKPPTNEIEHYIYWLNIFNARSSGVLAHRDKPDWYLFRPKTNDFKDLIEGIAKINKEIKEREDQEKRITNESKEKRKKLELSLYDNPVAIFTPEGKVHLLDTKREVKLWAKDHNLWDALTVAGANYIKGDEAPGSPNNTDITQSAPRAADFGFPTRFAIDGAMGWQSIAEEKITGSTKEFRDAVAEIHCAKTINDQLVGLLLLPKLIKKVMNTGLMTKSALAFLGVSPNENKLEATQAEALQLVKEQAGVAARELLCYRAAEMSDRESLSEESHIDTNLVRTVLGIIPSRRDFDSSLRNERKGMFETLRNTLLEMEYARELPLNKDSLAEIDRILVELIEAMKKIPKKHGAFNLIPRTLLRVSDKWKNTKAKELINDVQKKRGFAKIEFEFVRELFHTVSDFKPKIVNSPKKFIYPKLMAFKEYNAYFNIATDVVGGASGTWSAAKKADKAPGMIPQTGLKWTFLKNLSSLASQIPFPAVIAFGGIGLLENIYRGGQTHEHLKVLKKFEKLKRGSVGSRNRKYKTLIEGIGEGNLDEDKIKKLENELEKTKSPDLSDEVARSLIKKMIDRKGEARTRRGKRILIAASATALLVAGVATGGAALLVVGTVIGAAKTAEGIRKKYGDWKIQLDQQIKREAYLAAMSAQLGNPTMIELGLVLIFEFHDSYDYIGKYQAVENGMKFSDWHDGFIEGYQSFAKVK